MNSDGNRSADSAASELGSVRDYKLIAKLGEGGMGVVYRAMHTHLDKVVALKLLPRERVHDALAVERFKREMKAVGKLNHANIVVAHDGGEFDGTHFLVMELVEGLDLGQIVRRHGKLPIAEACEIVRQAAVALEYAHGQQFVHRDIKPSNLMLTTNGQVKVMDFGLALLFGQNAAADLTAVGGFLGTVDYMAPEQAEDCHDVDIRADIYSLGGTLYKLLTAHAPFNSSQYEGLVRKLMALMTHEVRPVQELRPSIPPGLAAVVQRMLAKRREDRFSTPTAVIEALAPFAAGAHLVSWAQRSLHCTLDEDAGAAGSGEFRATSEHASSPLTPTVSQGEHPRAAQPAASQNDLWQLEPASVRPSSYLSAGWQHEAVAPSIVAAVRMDQGDARSPATSIASHGTERDTEIRLTIQPCVNGVYPVLVSASAVVGDASGHLQLDSGVVAEHLRRLEQDVATEQHLREFGAYLFQVLFAGALQSTYEVNRHQVARAGAPVTMRVMLHILAPELRCMPWELLLVKSRKEWTATSSQTPLSRYVDVADLRVRQMTQPLRILICVSEPNDLAALSIQAELNAIEASLRPLREERLLQFSVLRHPRRDSFRRAIEEFSPQIMHFIGHGAQKGRVAGLYLEKADGAGDFVDTDILRQVFGRGSELGVVILNACESDEIAFALAEQGIVALGMRYPIHDAAAVHFCRNLYDALAQGTPLDAAVNDARFKVQVECGVQRRDWFLPVTYLPRGKSVAFHLEPSARPAQPAVVQVTSHPRGAVIVLDGQPLKKTSDDSIVIADDETHHVTVRLPGYRQPPAQVASRVQTTSPTTLHFELVPETGRITVISAYPNVPVTVYRGNSTEKVWSGATNSLGRCLPIELPPGKYRVQIIHRRQAATGPGILVQKSKEVMVAAESVLNLPFEADAARGAGRSSFAQNLRDLFSRVPLLANAAIAIGVLLATVAIGVLGVVIAWAVFDPLPQRAFPKPDDDMVQVREPRLYRGYWDDSVTVRLLKEHGEQATDLLDMTPTHEVSLEQYYIDRHEVTNAQYKLFLDDRLQHHTFDHADDRATNSRTPKYWDDDEFNAPDQPVVGIDWFDAYAYARWAKKRLPTEDEWEFAARTSDRRAYPWGNQYDEDIYFPLGADVESTMPVTALISARVGGPVGMAENVTEWVDDAIAEDPSRRIGRGGSWAHVAGDIYGLTFFRFYGDADSMTNTLGFRCAADVSSPSAMREGMIKIEGGTAILGDDDTPLVELLREEQEIVSNLTEAFLSEGPSTITVPAFEMDRYEVTNREYRLFLHYVQEMGDGPLRHPQQPASKDHTPDFWHDPDYNGDDQPVVGVDWYDAYAYAKWVGKRLPTADEWEQAARGATKQLYPWGDDFDAAKCVSQEAGADQPAAVDAPTEDVSPLGVVGLAGNVCEWTSSVDEGESAIHMIIRGGAFDIRCRARGVTYIRDLRAKRTNRENDLGFRCVRNLPATSPE